MRPPMFRSISDRWVIMCSLMFRSLLTRRTIVRRALPLRELAHGRATLAAGLLGPLVDEQLLLEVAGHAISAHVVAQGRPTHADCHVEHGSHGTRESCDLGA